MCALLGQLKIFQQMIYWFFPTAFHWLRVCVCVCVYCLSMCVYFSVCTFSTEKHPTNSSSNNNSNYCRSPNNPHTQLKSANNNFYYFFPHQYFLHMETCCCCCCCHRWHVVATGAGALCSKNTNPQNNAHTHTPTHTYTQWKLKLWHLKTTTFLTGVGWLIFPTTSTYAGIS